MFATTGFYRNSSVTVRGETTSLHCVPGAHIHVTETATGALAKIYYDPQMTKLVPQSTVVSDLSGGYDYYISLNYMVSENISAPGLPRITIPNIGINTK
jgi:hypothetical protein